MNEMYKYIIGIFVLVLIVSGGFYFYNKDKKIEFTATPELNTVLSGFDLDKVLNQEDVKLLNITKEKIINPKPVSFSDVNFKIETDKEVYTGIWGTWINVEVTNLGDKNDFELSLIFPEGRGINIEKIEEWKNINHPKQVYYANCTILNDGNNSELCNPYYQTEDNYYFDWKPSKQYIVNNPSKIEEKGDIINIGKGDTKTFRVYVSWALGSYGKFDVKGYHSKGSTILDPQWLSTGTAWSGTNSSVINDGENLTLEVVSGAGQEFTCPDENLTLGYPLSEGSGTTTADCVDDGLDASLNGTTAWYDGVVDSSVYVDTASYIEVPNTTRLENAVSSSSRTVEFFLNITSISSTKGDIFFHLGGAADNHGWQVSYLTNNNIEGIIRNQGTTCAVTIINPSLIDQQFHYYAMKFDNGAFSLEIDKGENGSASTSCSSSFTSVNKSHSLARFGCNAAGSQACATDYDVHGAFDGIAMWNYSRTSQQTNDTYDAYFSSDAPANSGNFTSTGLGDGDLVDWDEIEFRMDLDSPSTTNISISVRTSSDNSTWGAWTHNVTPFTDLGLQDNYLQWLAEFMGDGVNQIRLLYVNQTSNPPLPTISNHFLNSTTLLNQSGDDIFTEFNISDVNNTAVLTYNHTWHNDTGILEQTTEVSATNGNLVLLELTYANTTRGDNITSELIGCSEHRGCSYDNKTITIVSTPPTTPELNNPVNITTYELYLYEFNWSNGSDADNDNIYYIFEVDDNTDFSSINYANVSIDETTNTTSTFITDNLADGTYYWRVIATDLETNSSATAARQFILNTTRIINVDNHYDDPVLVGYTSYFEFNITHNNITLADVDAQFDYNGTEYTLSEENISSLETRFYRNITIPQYDVFTNVTFGYNLTLIYHNGSTYDDNTYFYGQVINPINFTLCDTDFNETYINFTFKDETDDSKMNATLSSSNIEYWVHADKAVTQTYSFSNSEELESYAFCFSPEDATVYTDITLNYKATGYPLRNYRKELTLTNETNNKTLYLLPTADGLYVTFQVINAAEQPIVDVYVLVERVVGGSYQELEARYTDAAGAATFWLDPNYIHRITFTKSGYNTYITTISPTQSVYTVTLSSTTETNETSFSRGISFSIEPNQSVLSNQTEYNFSFALTSSYHTIKEAGFDLSNSSGDYLNSVSCSIDVGCISSLLLTTDNYTFIYMNYYWIITFDGVDTYSNGTRSWYVRERYSESSSLTRIVSDIGKIGSGFDGFTRGLFVFFIIFMVTATAVYTMDMRSPLAILILITTLTGFFDVIGLLTNPINAIPYFMTIVMGAITMGYFGYEKLM